MKRVWVLIVMLMIAGSSVLSAAVKNDLVNRFAEVLKFKAGYFEKHKTSSDTKITPLFVRSSKENSIDLTMLIAYNKDITKAARMIIKDKVTPLIFSVSTMPFIETTFDPTDFCFEQDGIRWSPKNEDNSFDMFPLGENAIFGGNIDDNQIQQGVILLPGFFDITKSIKISYKNFKKVCLFK